METWLCVFETEITYREILETFAIKRHGSRFAETLFRDSTWKLRWFISSPFRWCAPILEQINAPKFATISPCLLRLSNLAFSNLHHAR
jgi:hypothetical protein